MDLDEPRSGQRVLVEARLGKSRLGHRVHAAPGRGRVVPRRQSRRVRFAILADGSVLIEEYNYAADHGYGQRIIQPGQAY